MISAGEMWNIGVILYVLYQGEYPFDGFSDEDIISEIINKPNMWKPIWKEGIGQSAKNFMMLLFDSNPYRRCNKANIINDPYILQHQTPSEIVGSNRALVNNLKPILKIFANECFIKALITYLSSKNYMNKVI